MNDHCHWQLGFVLLIQTFHIIPQVVCSLFVMEIQCNFMSARNTYNYLREERFFLSGGHKTGTKLLQKRYSGGKSFMVLATILILNISIHTILNIEYNTEVNIEVRRVQVLFVLKGFIFRC